MSGSGLSIGSPAGGSASAKLDWATNALKQIERWARQSNAGSAAYNNANSGLDALNAQDAIDELFADLIAAIALVQPLDADLTAIAATGFGRGAIVQTVRSSSGAVATGTTAIPGDDTVPQITEGDQYLSQAITPTSASNLLRIRARVILTNSNANVLVAAALFQDLAANALAATGETIPTAGHIRELSIDFTMVAGTTSATTFKIRGGGSTGATTTFNGTAGGRIFGGAFNSFLQIDEIVP